MPIDDDVMRYQVDRLRRDYADFVGDPEWAVVGDFFFERVYGTRDKAARDEAGRRLFEPARTVLGDEIGGNLGKLLELNELTDRLDRALVAKLGEMGVAQFSEPAYEEAYFRCDNHAARVRQIGLIADALEYFHRLAYMPGLGVGLTLLKPYAAIKKATAVYEFLRDGYRGFRMIQDIAPFVAAVRKREAARLDRIYRLNGNAVVRSDAPKEGRTTRRRTTS